MNICKLSFFHLMIWVHFPFVHFIAHFKILLNNLFCWFIFLWFLTSILMVIISLELTRVNLDRNVFSIKCGTTIYFFFFTEVWSITITKFQINLKVFKISNQTGQIRTHIFPLYSFLTINIYFNGGVISRNYALITRK